MATYGTYAAVSYRGVAGPVTRHERLVISPTAVPGHFVVVTPDNDRYIEEYTAGNPDIEDVQILANQGDIPLGGHAHEMYQFPGPFNPAQLHMLFYQGYQFAVAEHFERFLF